MAWVFLILASAFFNAFKNVATRSLGDSVDVYTVAFVGNLLMLPILWLNVFFFGSGVSVEAGFWLIMLATLPLEVLVMFLFFKAVTSSNLANSFPFISFMPAFVAVGSYILLQETLDLSVYFGISVVILGSFMLGIRNKFSRTDLVGIGCMLTAAALWGYLIPMGKLAIALSSSQLFTAIYFTLATFLFFFVFIFKHTTDVSMVFKKGKPFILIGVLTALYMITNWGAYGVGPAGPVSALAMLSIPLTSLGSMIFYNDNFNSWKLFSTVVMTAGAIIVVLG